MSPSLISKIKQTNDLSIEALNTKDFLVYLGKSQVYLVRESSRDVAYIIKIKSKNLHI